jgi:ABC-type thiamine transport system ATPase subunit
MNFLQNEVGKNNKRKQNTIIKIKHFKTNTDKKITCLLISHSIEETEMLDQQLKSQNGSISVQETKSSIPGRVDYHNNEIYQSLQQEFIDIESQNEVKVN